MWQSLHDMAEVIVVGPTLAVTDCPSAAGFLGPSISWKIKKDSASQGVSHQNKETGLDATLQT